MSEILADLSPPALVAAIKANPVEWWRYLGTSPQAEFHDSPELTWLLTGIPDSFVNTVFRTHAGPGSIDTIIEKTLAHFKSRDATTFSWWTEAGTLPTDLGERLVDHGLMYTDGSSGMAVDLRALNEDLPTPTGLRIECVDEPESLRKWAHASIVGFELPETCVDTWFELFADLGFHLPLRNYLGTLDGKPVAASELFLGAGVAGIYVVATVPEARRQGIGSAMTLTPLRDARAMGFRIGILHASSMGLGLYRRLGFQQYCRMSCYGVL
jgi:ribosomal protein S18 acetylase RimI-like enzyme